MHTLGRLEWVRFPQLLETPLKARIDTGAATTSLHCSSIRTHTAANGKPHVCFVLLDARHPSYTGTEHCLPIVAVRKVRSSNGQETERFFVKLNLALGPVRVNALCSLANRQHMKYPVLIGRNVLRKRFLVDVSLTYTS